MIAKAPRRNVFVDLSPLAGDGSNGGAAPSLLELLRLLLERPEPHAYHFMVKPPAVGLLIPHASRGATVHILGEDPRVAEPRRLLRARRRLPAPLRALLDSLWPDARSLRQSGAGTLFSPLQTATFHEPGLWHVAITYDFQELEHPAFFTEKERRRRREFRSDLRRADRVAAISAFTRRTAVEAAGLRPARVLVVPPVSPPRVPLRGPDLESRLASLGLSPGGFAFYPANFWPHKNHARLLAGIAAARGNAPALRLVLCGALDEGRARAAAEAARLGLTAEVILLPYVNDPDLTALLQGARFLVFPSLYEGFGIPVLEAFRLGTPVAAARIPALEELAADAALLFDPLDPAAIGSACARLWIEAEERTRLAALGIVRAQGFDPAKTADAFHLLLAGSRH